MAVRNRSPQLLTPTPDEKFRSRNEPKSFMLAANSKIIQDVAWLCPDCHTLLATRGTQEQAYARYLKHFHRAHSPASDLSKNKVGNADLARASAARPKADEKDSSHLSPKEELATPLVNCPDCNALLKARNLPRHRAKVHSPNRTRTTSISIQTSSMRLVKKNDLSRRRNKKRRAKRYVNAQTAFERRFLQGGLCNGR